MAAIDIASLEQEHGTSLPEAYKQLLQNYPAKLSSLNYFNDPEFGGPSDFELLKDLEKISKLNKEEKEFWPESDYADTPLPPTYFFIGNDGGGDLFAIDTAGDTLSPVLRFDHEEGIWETGAESLDEFVKQLIVNAKSR